MDYINRQSFSQKLKSLKSKPFSFIAAALVILAAVITAGTLLFIVVFILVKGIPNLSPKLFEIKYTSSNQSMLPALINTLIMTVISLALAVPIGIFSAVYLVEYAKKGSVIVKIIRVTAETLSGIPSIVYGLFGFILFVINLGWGYSLPAGALTLAIMILPLIMRTTEEALLAVPDSYREGSLGLGAGKLRTVFKIVIPSAVPGILSGVILAIGRIVGESAALIFTAGTFAQLPSGAFSSVRTLSVHLYALLSEGLYTNEAYATATVLLILTAAINAASGLIAKRLSSNGVKED